ncbi:MAG: hypothetical protein EA397_14325 [Deltaproteobacteria bacterium]|nr:MAG: hypothetical protein EA397_14325 [Deltaproteobacteria bacterium]
MKLPDARVGPYVRALAAALNAAAPNASHPPLLEGLALLRALDPAVSGTLLQPAEVDERSGMPSWAWVERVRAEAQSQGTPDARQIEQAQRLDPELAARMIARRDLLAHLASREVLPLRRISARVQRRGPPHQIRVVSDRVGPDGRWVRTLVALQGPTTKLGCAEITADGRVVLDPGVEHLLARHAFSPLAALFAQLSQVIIGEVVELSRGIIGPVWFPGVALPQGLPPELGKGLVVHLPLEVLATEIRRDIDEDPLGSSSLRSPKGYGWARQRRFVSSGRAREPLRAWLSTTHARCEVVEL